MNRRLRDFQPRERPYDLYGPCSAHTRTPRSRRTPGSARTAATACATSLATSASAPAPSHGVAPSGTALCACSPPLTPQGVSRKPFDGQGPRKPAILGRSRNRKRPAVRRASLFVTGGAGSRTRVPKPFHQSVYVCIPPIFSPPGPGRKNPRKPAPVFSRPFPLWRGVGTSPSYCHSPHPMGGDSGVGYLVKTKQRARTACWQIAFCQGV